MLLLSKQSAETHEGIAALLEGVEGRFQSVRVPDVVLHDLALPRWSDPEISAPLSIEKARTHGGGIQTGRAEPVYGSLVRDQGAGLQISHDTLIFKVLELPHGSFLLDSGSTFHCHMNCAVRDRFAEPNDY